MKNHKTLMIFFLMKYISDTQVGVCGVGIYTVENMRVVYQPNGTTVVLTK